MVSTILTSFNNDLAAVSELALRSLVRVRNGAHGVGAGTIWHTDGLILTNNHVVEGSGRRPTNFQHSLTVVLPDGRELPATVLARDPDNDLAALRVQATGLPTIELGDSRQLHAGELVVALGFPWGVTGGATTGVVIGSGADLPENGDNRREWLAASLHLRPGHSGGPMIDTHGRLIGINTMMNGPDVGVAVPVHVAKAFLKRAYAQPPQGRTVMV
jgi:serine protease Do